MLLRTQVLRRDAEDAVESGGLTRDIAEAAVREVHEAAARGLAFVAINVFGFVTRKHEAQVPELNTVSVQETSEPGSRAAKRPA
jgi:methylmalonyl-CoA mutase N-terminal domain/subunit